MANEKSLRQHGWGAAASKIKAIDEVLTSCNYLDSNPNLLIKNKLYRGGIAEIQGRRSSGRTSLCFRVLAQATARGEVCAVVDMQNSFDPASAEVAGVELAQIVWVRCRGDMQHTMKAADLLLHAGGFGVVLLDVCEASTGILQRIPLAYWYRLQRAVEHTPTMLLVATDSSQVKCSSTYKFKLKRKVEYWAGKAPFERFEGLEIVAFSSKTLAAEPEFLLVSSVA